MPPGICAFGGRVALFLLWFRTVAFTFPIIAVFVGPCFVVSHSDFAGVGACFHS